MNSKEARLSKAEGIGEPLYVGQQPWAAGDTIAQSSLRRIASFGSVTRHTFENHGAAPRVASAGSVVRHGADVDTDMDGLSNWTGSFARDSELGNNTASFGACSLATDLDARDEAQHEEYRRLWASTAAPPGMEHCGREQWRNGAEEEVERKDKEDLADVLEFLERRTGVQETTSFGSNATRYEYASYMPDLPSTEVGCAFSEDLAISAPGLSQTDYLAMAAQCSAMASHFERLAKQSAEDAQRAVNFQQVLADAHEPGSLMDYWQMPFLENCYMPTNGMFVPNSNFNGGGKGKSWKGKTSAKNVDFKGWQSGKGSGTVTATSSHGSAAQRRYSLTSTASALSQALSSAPATDAEVMLEKLDASEWVTVMLRNLPNDYSRDMILELLDSEGFAGLYDFFYLPIDFKKGANLGYAFINMVTHEAALRVQAAFHGYCRWKLGSAKVIQVSWGESEHQGLQKHVARYRNSPVMHPDVPDEYRPLVFADGQRIPFPAPTKAPRKPRIKTGCRGRLIDLADGAEPFDVLDGDIDHEGHL